MSTNALSMNIVPPSLFDGYVAPPPRTAIRLPVGRRSQPRDTWHELADRHLEGQPFDGQPHGHIEAEAPATIVQIAPSGSVKRRSLRWRGMAAEIVQETGHETIEYRWRASVHLLVLCERGVRSEGETILQGLPPSTLHDATRKLTFVPAGHEYYERREPRNPARMIYVYFDPAVLPLHGEPGSAGMSLAPRLYFEDAALWTTALKLAALIEDPGVGDQTYFEALGLVLAHELVRLQLGTTQSKPSFRGGLAAWQQRTITAYMEEHLGEQLPLATLAALVGLSPYHFCRAFKQSFGIPPRRYHTSRRIEYAKMLLAKPALSVTDIGLTVGFSETSSFTAAFRKATGQTPSGYHRSLG